VQHPLGVAGRRRAALLATLLLTLAAWPTGPPAAAWTYSTLAEVIRTSSGTISTRIRERSTGEVSDLPWGALMLSSMALPPAADVVTALEELELQGVVVRSVAVHPFDSTTYQVSWSFTEP